VRDGGTRWNHSTDLKPVVFLRGQEGANQQHMYCISFPITITYTTFSTKSGRGLSNAVSNRVGIPGDWPTGATSRLFPGPSSSVHRPLALITLFFSRSRVWKVSSSVRNDLACQMPGLPLPIHGPLQRGADLILPPEQSQVRAEGVCGSRACPV
jgi:hypothetical protein